MQVSDAILDHLSGYRMIEDIYSLIKGTAKFLRQYRNDSGVLGLNDYVFRVIHHFMISSADLNVSKSIALWVLRQY